MTAPAEPPVSDELGALAALKERIQAIRAEGPHGSDRSLNLEILLYIATELRLLRLLIDQIDRGRSEW